MPSDMLGVILDQADLAERITTMLRMVAELVPASGAVALVVGLPGVSAVTEGGISDLGQRNSASLTGFGRDNHALVEPRDTIPAGALSSGAVEVGREFVDRPSAHANGCQNEIVCFAGIQQGPRMSVDPVALYGTFQYYKVHFTLSAESWAAFDPGITLAWQVHDFTSVAAPSVPSLPGVYAFMVNLNIAGNLSAQYLMYVGKAEDRGLRRRFREYLKEASSSHPRPKLGRLFALWAGRITFHCAPTGPLSPSEVEDKLLAALVPPMNDELPATIRAGVRAF